MKLLLVLLFNILWSPLAFGSGFCQVALANIDSLENRQRMELEKLDRAYKILKEEDQRLLWSDKITDEERAPIREIEGIPKEEYFQQDEAIRLYSHRVDFLLRFVTKELSDRYVKLFLSQINKQNIVEYVKTETSSWMSLTRSGRFSIDVAQLEHTLANVILRTPIRNFSESSLAHLFLLGRLNAIRQDFYQQISSLGSKVSVLARAFKEDDVGIMRLSSVGTPYNRERDRFSEVQAREIKLHAQKILEEDTELLSRLKPAMAQVDEKMKSELKQVPEFESVLPHNLNLEGQIWGLLVTEENYEIGCCSKGCQSCPYRHPSPTKGYREILPRASPFGHSKSGLPFYVVADDLKGILPPYAFELPKDKEEQTRLIQLSPTHLSPTQ